MSDSSSQNSIKDRVTKAIKTGKVHMRPRWKFVAATAAFVAGAVFVVLTLLYIASFIVFISHKNGVWFAPAFGIRGLYIFVSSFPWLLVLVALIFIGLLLLLVRRYSFAYGRPLLYSSLLIIILVALAGLAIARTPLHRGLFLRAQQHHLPFAERLYRDDPFFGRPDQVTPGIIIELNDTGFNIESRHQEMVEVIITPETRLPFGADFSEGDTVVVLGPREGQVIRAFGVREIESEEFMVFPPNRQRFNPYPPQMK